MTIRRFYENLHIPLWLVKDTCWAMQFKTLGVIMIVPTLFLAIRISLMTPKDKIDFLPNISICFWITANSIWMCDEFFEMGIKNYCLIPFGIGLVFIFFWLLFIFPKAYRTAKMN